MLLAFDVGNTNTVVGLFDGDELTAYWRFTTERNRTADELRLTARTLLAETDVGPADVEGIAVASVVPTIDAPLRNGLERLTLGEIRFLTHRTSPIELRVDEPWSVGADRIANSFAGHALHGGPILVIDFGTATTFDLVSEDGAFLGGAIAPEMRLTARALTDRAAQLPSVTLDVPDSVVGKTTAENLRAGIVFGFLDLVDGLIARFRAEVSGDLKVLATGGKGELFYRELDAIELYDPHLTLTGLLRWWRRTADELRLTTRTLLAESSVEPADVEGITVASVVPSVDAPLRNGLERLTTGEIRFLTHRTSPIELRVDEPWSVGADRIANSFAGHALHGGPILVIDFGTATTFDLVSADGAFLGGAIAPEMHLTARALTDRAAQLPSVAVDVPDSVVGRTTAENLRAGIVFGFLDLVDGLIARFRAEAPEHLKVLATGGKGELFYRELDAIDLYDPHLTLTGLLRWWRKTADPASVD